MIARHTALLLGSHGRARGGRAKEVIDGHNCTTDKA